MSDTAAGSAPEPADRTPPHLFLIRHGETEWSRSGRHTGLSDIPLTANGEREARDLLPWLRHVPFSGVLTSPRLRARRTCELAGLGANATVEPDLAEWDYGDYEGLRSDDIRKARPGWNIFTDGCPAGESPAAIGRRADGLIARLRRFEGNVALFSHGQFGSVLAARWIGLAVAEGQHFSLDPAALGVLASDPHHQDVAVIARWNARPNEAAFAG